MKQLPDGTKIENWTAYPVQFVDLGLGQAVIIPTEEGGPARLKMEHERVEGTEYVTRTVFLEGDNLPSERPGVFLIVSGIWKGLYPGRHDLVVPNQTIRMTGAKMTCCQGFAI